MRYFALFLCLSTCSIFAQQPENPGPPGGQGNLEERVAALEALVTQQQAEIASLTSQVQLLKEFTFHLFRMNKDVIGKPILDLQGKAIQQRIGRVPCARVNVVCGECDLFPQEFVVEH